MIRFVVWWLFWFRGYLAAVRMYNVAWMVAQRGNMDVAVEIQTAAQSVERFMRTRLNVALGRMTPEEYDVQFDKGEAA